MLSQKDQQALAEIEEYLRAHDPDLVRQFDSWCGGAPRRRRVRLTLGLVGLLWGAFLGTVALLAHNADAAVLAVAVSLMGAVWWVTPKLTVLIGSRVVSRRGRDDHP